MKKNNDYLFFEGYKLTNEPLENINTPELKKQLSRLHEDIYNKQKKGVIKELVDLISKYPQYPILKNYLSNAYSVRGENEKSIEVIDWTIAEHPEYLYGRILKANLYVEDGVPEKVKELLGEELELKALYPERDLFHITELASFLGIVVTYYIAIDDLDAADKEIERMGEVCPEHPTFVALTRKLMIASIEKGRKRLQESEEKRIKVISDKPTPKNTETRFPVFNHKEILDLYEYEYDIPQYILEDILALPKETLIEDLEKVLRDAVDRNDYFVANVMENLNFFPFHAIILLTELKSEKSLSLILEIFSYNSDFL